MTIKKHLGIYSLVLTAVLVLTFYWFPEFSVLGFVTIALFALEVSSELFERLFQARLNVDEELLKENRAVSFVIGCRYIAYAIVIAAALIGVPKAIGADLPHVFIAKQYINHVEQRGNRGYIIDGWNREAKNALGSPYCAAFVAHCLNSAGAIRPTYRGGYSRYYIDKTSVALPASIQGNLAGWLLVFKRKGGGHIGIITYSNGNYSRTIEANTSGEGYAGSQYDGGGVFERTRNLRTLASPYNVFRATHITPVRYS